MQKLRWIGEALHPLSAFFFLETSEEEPVLISQPWCWGLYPRLYIHIHTHTYIQALLVQVIMTLVDPLTQVMYFCAVCQLLSVCSGSSLGHALSGMLMKNDRPLLHATAVPYSPPASPLIEWYFWKNNRAHFENHSRYSKKMKPPPEGPTEF